MGRSFTYLFDDENWLTKILIGGIVGIVPILNFAVFGYMLEATKNVAEGRTLPLPEWGEDFGGKFVRGLLAIIMVIIYLIPIWAIWCLFLAISAIFGGAAALDSEALAESLLPVLYICFQCLIALYGFAMIIWLPAALTRYALNGDFGSAFQFGEIWSFIQSNLDNYLLAVVLYVVASIIAGFGIIACGVGVLFTTFWAYLVYAFLLGNVWREAELRAT